MMPSRKQRTFANQTVSDIVGKVCRDHGISASTSASGAPLDFVFQHNETDFELVHRLGQRVGFELVVDGSDATFGPPDANGRAVELSYPDQLRAFRPRITAVQQVESVTVRGFDLKAKQAVQTTKSSPNQVAEAGITRSDVSGRFPGATLEVAGQSFSTRGEADQIAQAALDQLANAYLAAEGSCKGDPGIKAGAKVNISGVGESYSGTYRVAKAVHVLRTGGYVTQFSNSTGEHTLLGQSGGGNGGPIHADSIVVGLVTNNNDPEKLGRVKVQLPALSNEETFWAPVVVPSAGKERGISMLPVVGEQVVIAFENGDPSYPFVMGSVFNGRDTPGDAMAVQDGSFALKSDHKALVAAKEDINLRSDEGKWLIDLNGGEIKETVKAGSGGGGAYKGSFDGDWGLTAKKAITIESNMSVTIKAPQIKVQAQGALDLEAQGQVSLKGASVQIQGQAAVNISGGIINLG